MNAAPTPFTLRLDDPCWKSIGVFSKAVQRCERLAQVGHCYRCPVFASAARQVLDREAEVQLAAAPPAAPLRGVDNTPLKLFLFRLGGEWLGWPLAKVREVADFKPLHALPNQHNPLLKGLVNINGELMLCVSLGLLLGLQRSSGEPERCLAPRMLVLGTQNESWVVPLSEARGRVGFATSALQPPPHTAGLPQVRYSLGVLPWEGKQVNYLDSTAVLQALRERSHVSNTGL